MAPLEELQSRVQRLEDIKQIERLQRIYGYYRDYGEWEKIVDLFSDNAESIEVADHGVYKGKEGIRRYYIDLIKGEKTMGGQGEPDRAKSIAHSARGSNSGEREKGGDLCMFQE